jgi:hypothetical protein
MIFPAKSNRRIVNIKDFGANPSSLPKENSMAVRRAISAGEVIKIGDYGESYLFSEAIKPKSNQTLIIDSNIKIIDTVSSILTSDVTAGQVVINLQDASLFHVGQTVSIKDDNSTVYNYRGYILIRCWGGTIIAKNGNSITLNSTFSQGTVYQTIYEVSQNAICMTTQGVVHCEDLENITVIGNGTIDGNRQGQFYSSPSSVDGGVEYWPAITALLFFKCKGIQVRDINVNNARVHGLGIYGLQTNYCERANVQNVKVNGSHQKNIEIRYLRNSLFNNIEVSNAVTEDGFIFYIRGENNVVRNLTTKNNFRFGYALGSNTFGIETYNVESESNGSANLSVKAWDSYIKNFNSRNGTILISQQYPCYNIIIDDLSIINGNSNRGMLRIEGNVKDITINNLTMQNTSGIAILANDDFSPGLFAERFTINRESIVNHSGTLFSIPEQADIIFNNFST